MDPTSSIPLADTLPAVILAARPRGLRPPPFVVPGPLRERTRIMPRQPGRRQSAIVGAREFERRGLPVPDERTRRNIHQLTGGRGYPWSAEIDAWVAQHGAEIVSGPFMCVDADTTEAVDGGILDNGIEQLAGAAIRAGELLDMSQFLAVRTPGHSERGHAPGWHLVFRLPVQPIRFGPLGRFPTVELKERWTCPGSPGYEVRSVPDDELPELPAWICELAGKPRLRAPSALGARGAGQGRTSDPPARMGALLRTLREGRPGSRNGLLHWTACRFGELVADGDADRAIAERQLRSAAEDIGLTPGESAATIASGLRAGGAR